jgi:hypothetical protein
MDGGIDHFIYKLERFLHCSPFVVNVCMNGDDVFNKLSYGQTYYTVQSGKVSEPIYTRAPGEPTTTVLISFDFLTLLY